MAVTGTTEQLGRPWRRRGATVFALACCIGMIAFMAWVLLREIEEVSTANSDNLQWSLAQADVEFLRFELAMQRAQVDPTRVDQVRRRFDIFYSRMDTIENGIVFRALRRDPTYDEPRAIVRAFLQDAIPLIDGDDKTLIAALPDLSERAQAVSDEVRRFSLAGLAAFAEVSDARREDLVRTLILLAIVLGALLGGLVLVALAMFRLSQIAIRRSDEVRRTSARMRTIVETSQDAIIVANTRGLILEFNPAAQEIFEIPREEALGERLAELVLPERSRSKARDTYFRFMNDGSRDGTGALQFEVTAKTRGGREFPAEVAVNHAEDASGRQVHVVYMRDISRRRAAENNLTEARDRALAGERAKAEFLAVMSHEMRTPLNGLLGSMQLMRDQDVSDRQQELLSRMEFSGRLLLSLVNDVLDLAKYEAGRIDIVRKPYSVPRLLDGVIETTAPLASKNGNVLEWRWEGTPAEGAVGDPRRLRQVLLNLVGNAVKFTRSGTVEIEAEVVGTADPQLEFRVIDSGVGIASEDLDRIFRDFETLDSSYARQAGGTGLGLGIARRFAKLMGGEIGVESEPGEGSLFWLRLPFEPVDLSEPEQTGTKAEPAPSIRPLDILLVEDNEINRLVAREILEADGHSVTEAVNGRAGVEWANARRFDAILMDVSMPVMDGPEAARTIRSGTGPSAATPIIAVTAHALPEEIAEFRKAGMPHCVSKPLDRNVLQQTLAEVAGAAPPVAEPVAAVAPEAKDDPLLDAENLARFASGKSTGLLDRSVAEINWDIDRIAEATLAPTDLQQVVHKCAGTCGVFGFTALRSALAAVETDLKRETAVEPERLAALAVLWEETREALQDWRAAQP
ncbi:ATP-binding protein [Psychromarinibacter sp. S121]|uniref:hybrid sensor histidine kinase/response regulator n=1 Tax=Psychromarinibacter sp. S121 TaxID=3415127 RepID=UPI003C7A6472